MLDGIKFTSVDDTVWEYLDWRGHDCISLFVVEILYKDRF